MSLGGQTVLVTSEFVRYAPDGSVLQADKADKYRELLSPAVVRNAHFTFRVTVRQPEGSPYTLHIAQNPEDTAQIRLYQEQYTEIGGQWVPDRLKPVEMPHGATMAPGQKAQSYLVDLFLPAGALANQRFRIEVQFYRGDGWQIHPMEMRVRQAAVEGKVSAAGPEPEAGVAPTRVITGPLRAYACGVKQQVSAAVPLETGRALLLRNILEDLNLARQREKTDTREGTVFMLLKAAGVSDLPAFCAAKAAPAAEHPEWWLKVRDYLYQGRPVP